MDLRNLISGLFWLAISAVIVFGESFRGSIGTFHYPGPGFMPFWAGVILGVLAVIVICSSISSRTRGGAGIEDLWTGKKWGNAFLVTLCLLIYALLLPWIGYLIATFALMILLYGLMGRQRWWFQGIGALVTSAVTYFVFHSWLDVQLPKGILGF